MLCRGPHFISSNCLKSYCILEDYHQGGSRILVKPELGGIFSIKYNVDSMKRCCETGTNSSQCVKFTKSEI